MTCQGDPIGPKRTLGCPYFALALALGTGTLEFVPTARFVGVRPLLVYRAAAFTPGAVHLRMRKDAGNNEPGADDKDTNKKDDP